MNTIKHNTVQNEDDQKENEQASGDSVLGWEGHVHFPNGVPIWKRVLESWPELRTGLAYCLVFASGILLGSGITALLGSKRNHPES